jgi:putative salt-induced outer membrane protein
MFFMKLLALILGIMLAASLAFGQEARPANAAVAPAAEAQSLAPALATAATSTWSGEAEAGGVNTSGNTETRSINTKLKIANVRERWDNRLRAAYLEASDRSVTTAERTTASFESHYRLSLRAYLFGVARYDADTFSGYARQYTETAGYGRRFLFSPDTTLEAEAGAGGRQVRLSDGSKKRDGIVRLAATFGSKFAPKSEFKEEAFCELSSDNTHSESTTSLQSRINGNLSLKTAYTLTHNSRTPLGVARTDTITSITLVVDFGT